MAREDFGFQRRKGRGPRQQPTVACVTGGDDREPEPGDRAPEGVFARMLKADRRVSRAIHDAVLDRGAVPRWALEALERAGSGLIWFPGTLAALGVAFGSRTSSPQAFWVLSNFMAGLVLDVLIVGTVKGAFRRRRPNYTGEENGGYKVRLAPVQLFSVVFYKADPSDPAPKKTKLKTIIKVDSFSFPSGHTSRSAFVALFLLLVAGGGGGAGPIAAVVWALATAASRVALGRHYASDVAAGMVAAALNVALLTKGHFSGEVWSLSPPRAALLCSRLLP